jgi:hypothetical protein
MPKIGTPSPGEPWATTPPKVTVSVTVQEEVTEHFAKAVNQVPLPRKPEEQQERYPHVPADHICFPGGTLFCVCLCDVCWPPEGGNCPDERRV